MNVTPDVRWLAAGPERRRASNRPPTWISHTFSPGSVTRHQSRMSPSVITETPSTASSTARAVRDCGGVGVGREANVEAVRKRRAHRAPPKARPDRKLTRRRRVVTLAEPVDPDDESPSSLHDDVVEHALRDVDVTCGVGPGALVEDLPVLRRRLVRTDLRGDHRLVERHADRRLRRLDEVAVGVREDREPPAAGARAFQCLPRLGERRPARQRAPERVLLAGRHGLGRGPRTRRIPRGSSAPAPRARSPARARGSGAAARRHPPPARAARAPRGSRRSSRSACRSSQTSPTASYGGRYASSSQPWSPSQSRCSRKSGRTRSTSDQKRRECRGGRGGTARARRRLMETLGGIPLGRPAKPGKWPSSSLSSPRHSPRQSREPSM